MTRALVILNSKADRDKVADWITRLPQGTRVEFKKPKRSLPQNDRMWAALTDIAEQLPWHGVRLVPDDWKLIFLDALNRELRIVPNIDGTGFVNLGRSSSDLSKEEFSDLLELIAEFGARHGIVFHEPSPALAENGDAGGARANPPAPSTEPIQRFEDTFGAETVVLKNFFPKENA